MFLNISSISFVNCSLQWLVNERNKWSVTLVKNESFRNVYLKFDQDSFIIRRVACVPKLNMSIISMAKLHEEGCEILFDDHVTILRENITLCVGREKQRLYDSSLEPIGLEVDKTTRIKFELMIPKVKEDQNIVMWHKRLAHMTLADIHILINSHYLYHIKMVNKFKCVDCKRLKPHTHPLETRLERATNCMECVHMFIYGPHHIATKAC